MYSRLSRVLQKLVTVKKYWYQLTYIGLGRNVLDINILEAFFFYTNGFHLHFYSNSLLKVLRFLWKFSPFYCDYRRAKMCGNLFFFLPRFFCINASFVYKECLKTRALQSWTNWVDFFVFIIFLQKGYKIFKNL